MKTPKDYSFFYGAKAGIFKNARALKKNSTDSEKILWQQLRAKKLCGMKFRRQHAIKQFIVDFYCDKIKLVIELDGGYHNHPEIKEHDEGREFMLKELGLNIIRFTNDEVDSDIKTVLKKIEEYIKINS